MLGVVKENCPKEFFVYTRQSKKTVNLTTVSFIDLCTSSFSIAWTWNDNRFKNSEELVQLQNHSNLLPQTISYYPTKTRGSQTSSTTDFQLILYSTHFPWQDVCQNENSCYNINVNTFNFLIHIISQCKMDANANIGMTSWCYFMGQAQKIETIIKYKHQWERNSRQIKKLYLIADGINSSHILHQKVE